MKYWTLVIFLFGAMNFFAQPKHAEIEEVNGKKYYVHIVQTGNSLWGIHVLYNVNVDDIVSANPGVENGIKDGQKLLIPVGEVATSPTVETQMTKETKHIVKKQETMYGISKKYGVTIEQIISVNPSAKDGLKLGQELIIPSVELSKTPPPPIPNKSVIITFSDTVIEHVVLAHETIYSISKRFMVPVADLQSVNELKHNKIRTGDIIKIPIKKEKIQKIEIREVVKVETQKVDSNLLFKRKGEYSIALLLPFFLEKENGYSESISDLSTQFYMGAQLAIDSLETLGLKANIYIYDTQNDTVTIKAVLKKSEFQNMDMVIGPLFPDKMGIVAKWCKANKVKFVCPVACNSDILKENPFVYSAIPSDATLIEGAAKYLLNRVSNDQIVLVKPNLEKDIALYDRFRSAYMALPFKGVRPKLIETNLQDFKTYIKKGGNTFFIIPTLDEATAKKFMNSLIASSNNINSSISVFGTKEWLLFDDINGAYKNKYNFHFSSSNDFNYSLESTKYLAKIYRKSYNADMPKMAVQGFDLMIFFCSKYLLMKEASAGVMSNFNMVQKGSGNGFENNNCFILKQADFEIIKVEETND